MAGVGIIGMSMARVWGDVKGEGVMEVWEVMKVTG
jgi:predicted lipoprotein with Yx(FWY)xxD motif